MRHSSNLSYSPRMGKRQGVTLVEVLMSLMIMSIGVSSVMVLFPISVLRSVQSTQLTNAAILKRSDPKLIFDPDGNYDLAATDVLRASALAEHFQGAANRNYVIDPAGFYALFGQDNDGNGTVEMADDLFARSLGNVGAVAGYTVGVGMPPVQRFLPRFDGRVMSGFLNNSTATSFSLSSGQLSALAELGLQRCRLGDGRTVQLDTFFANSLSRNLPRGTYGPAGPYLVGIQLVNDVAPDDLSQIPVSSNSIPGNLIADPENSEIVIFSANGNFSQTFPLTHIDATRRAVFWSEYDDNPATAWRDFNRNSAEDVRPLPREFQNTAGRIVLRSRRAADFTWLITVRRASDGRVSGADVVVRHNVGISVEDERVFPAVFTAGSTFVGVNNWPDGTAPVMKRGQFILDPVNARWYRIAAVTLSSSSTPLSPWSNFAYRVELENAAIASSGSLPSGGNPMIPGAAIVVPHIIDVYPLGSMSFPETF